VDRFSWLTKLSKIITVVSVNIFLGLHAVYCLPHQPMSTVSPSHFSISSVHVQTISSTDVFTALHT